MAGELERLLIRLEADTTQLRRQLSDADKQVGGFAGNIDRSLSRSSRSFAAMAGSVGISLGRLTSIFGATALAMKAFDAINTAGSINDMARAAALGTDSFQSLAYAAGQAGMSQDEFAAAMKRLSVSMAELRTNSGPLNEFLNDHLPLVAQQLRATDSQQQALNVLADTMRRLRSEEDKTTLAQQAFGKSGADMVEVLQRGSAGLQQMTDRAHELGLVQSGEMLDTAEEIKKKYAELGATIEAAWQRAVVAVAGYVKEVVKAANTNPLAGTPLGGYGAIAQMMGVAGLSNKPDNAAEDPATWMQGQSVNPMADGMIELGASVKDINQEWQKLNATTKEFLAILASDPTIAFADKFSELDKAVREGKIGFQDYGKITNAVQKDQIAQAQQTTQAVANALETTFQNNKSAAIAAALMNTAVGVTKAFAELTPPFSWITATATAAAGAAQVAMIRSTNRGGGGGVAPVAAPAAPASSATVGESGAGRGPLQAIHVTLNGEMYSRDQVRQMIEGLNDAISDGARLYVGDGRSR